MNLNDHMKVITVWNTPFASNPIENVWNFQCLTADSPTELQTVGNQIAAAFFAKYINPLLPALSNNIQFTMIRLRSYEDPTEGYDLPMTGIYGGASVRQLPAFVTYSVWEHRSSLATHHGRKGIPGVRIDAVDDGGVPTGAIKTQMATIFAGWQEDGGFFVEERGYYFAPRILRLSNSVPPTVLVSNPITGYSFTKFGTQNTRKGS